METLAAYFYDAYRFARPTQWFKRGLYVLLLIKAITWLCYFDLYFGADGLVYSQPMALHGPADLAYFLYAHHSPQLAGLFIGALAALCLLCLFRPRLWLVPDLLIWFLAVNLHYKVYPTLTGGDYLLNQFLLFNCFLSASSQVKEGWRSSLKILLHNLAVVAVIVQVCIVYLFSALAKCTDAAWLSGQAVYSIAQLRHYAPGWQLFHGPGLLALFLNYLVLGYQLLFPALIWMRPLKKTLIVIGLLMHLYIGLAMGLPWFAAVMMLAYVYFWPSRK